MAEKAVETPEDFNVDLSDDNSSIELLSIIAKAALARGRLEDAIKACRAAAQIRGALGPGGEARTKEVAKMGTSDLIRLRNKLSGAA